MSQHQKLRPGREVRDLAALQRNGSSSRVLNLAWVEKTSHDDPEHKEAPFFLNRTLNGAIIVKHKVRADERDLMESAPPQATKVIVPFAGQELTLGGQSLLVGQYGWRDLLADLCSNADHLERDAHVLTVIDKLPSLDPFLLREYLKRHGYDIGACYFAISPADYERMQMFVRREVSKLIDLAFADQVNGAADSAKLVQILLSTEVDERFEPLRRTMGLEGEAYKEGVFSWKGFLYYKWAMTDLGPKLDDFVHELKHIAMSGPREPDLMNYIEGARASVIKGIEVRRVQVAEALKIYDDAFSELTDNRAPSAFKDFLSSAPAMFMTLGDRIGGISHIASFWRYCVPRPNAGPMPVGRLADILADFDAALSVEPPAVDEPLKKAVGI
jgi:hypothetical protein